MNKRLLIMNYKVLLFPVLILIVITGCDVFSSERNSDPAIKQGEYIQRAQKISVEGSVVSAGPIGGYFQQTFVFSDAGEADVKVSSDIPSENGTAKASYNVSGDNLILNINQSKTSAFPEGKEITYRSYKQVNDQYKEPFESAPSNYTFEGSGLILTKEQPDKQDLDEDGDVTEKIVLTEYYKYVVRYDDL